MADLIDPLEYGQLYSPYSGGGLGSGGDDPYSAMAYAPGAADQAPPPPPQPPAAPSSGLSSLFPSWLGGTSDQAPTRSALPQTTGIGGLGSNSLIGLGLGLMAGNRFDPYGRAIAGFQTGARTDLSARQAESAAQQARDLNAYRQQELRLRTQQLFRDPEQIRTLQALMARGVPQDRAMEMMFPRTEAWQLSPNGDAMVNKNTGEIREIGQSLRKPTSHEESQIQAADDMVAANQNVIANLQRAKELSPRAAVGPFSEQRGQISAALGLYGGEETVNLRSAVNEASLTQLKTIFGPKPNKAQIGLIDDLKNSIDKPDAVRQKIYDNAIEMAQRQLAINDQRARELRAGRYYKPGGGAEALGGEPGSSRENPIQVTSPTEALKHKPGTWIVNPEGRVGRVPRGTL